jgi:hypothetical protein
MWPSKGTVKYHRVQRSIRGDCYMWSVGCPFRSGWFANMVSSFAFVVIKGPSLIKIISVRNQDIIMVYEAVIKVDIYGVGLANTRTQL